MLPGDLSSNHPLAKRAGASAAGPIDTAASTSQEGHHSHAREGQHYHLPQGGSAYLGAKVIENGTQINGNGGYPTPASHIHDKPECLGSVQQNGDVTAEVHKQLMQRGGQGKLTTKAEQEKPTTKAEDV